MKSSISLLALILPAVTDAAPPSYIWQVTGLKATDQPIDPTQTGPTPALHSLSFNITDESANATFACSAGWVNADKPATKPTKCKVVSGSGANNVTFSFEVPGSSSASSGFNVSVTEYRVSAEYASFHWSSSQGFPA